MAQLRKPSLLLLTGLCLGFSLATGLSAAYADPALTPDDNISFGDDASSQSGQKSAEKKTVHGHRSLPPGYQDAPAMEFNHGADPDHLAKVHRDAVTGSDLSRYGSAYESSGPYGSGQMGDATGNGWVTPR